MNKRIFPHFRFGSAVTAMIVMAFFTQAGVAASTDEILRKARAHLGGDDALNKVEAIYFEGTITNSQGDVGRVQITFQKPMHQKITIEIGSIRETTALNNYEGWRKLENLEDADSWELSILQAPQVRRLRANTFENLAFYRGLDRRGGRLENHGIVSMDGRDCIKVAFIHSPTIQFIRYFDSATGQLVRTETEDGGSIREEGELRVSGVRFPKRLITVFNDAETVIEFEDIRINDRKDESFFDFPILTSGRP